MRLQRPARRLAAHGLSFIRTPLQAASKVLITLVSRALESCGVALQQSQKIVSGAVFMHTVCSCQLPLMRSSRHLRTAAAGWLRLQQLFVYDRSVSGACDSARCFVNNKAAPRLCGQVTELATMGPRTLGWRPTSPPMGYFRAGMTRRVQGEPKVLRVSLDTRVTEQHVLQLDEQFTVL